MRKQDSMNQKPARRSESQPIPAAVRARIAFVRGFLTGWMRLFGLGGLYRLGKGTKLGRPKVSKECEAQILELRSKKMGMIKIGKKLGIGTSTVQRVIAQ